MLAQPYLFFDGRAEEAIEFYKTELGATVINLMRYSDSPEPPPPGMVPEGSKHKIMHASLQIGETQLMVSDGSCQGLKPDAFKGFSLALTLKGEAEVARVFGRLAEGGSVGMPLGKTFFSPSFGMVADRFGVPWMVVAE